MRISSPAGLLDLQDRSLSERHAFSLAINSHLSWWTGLQVCGRASPEWSVDREAIKVSIRHKIPNILLCFKFTKIFHLELIFMWKFCRINLKISSTNFHYLRNLFKFSWASSQKFPPFSLFFSSWDKFPPSTYALDCRFLDVGLWESKFR